MSLKNKNIGKKKLLFLGKRSFHSLGCYDNSYIELVSKNFDNLNVIYACSNLLDKKEIDGIQYLKIFKYNKLTKFRKIFSYIYSLLKLLFFIKKNNPNYIHIQWLLLPGIDYIWLSLLRILCWKGVFIITIHNAKNRESSFSKIFTKLCYQRINRFVVHSFMCKNYLIQKYPFIKKEIIYIGRHGIIDTDSNSELIHEEEKILNDIKTVKKKYKKIYIFIGIGSIYKGFDLLLGAWKLYKENSNNKNNSGLIILGKVDHKLTNKISKLKLDDKSIVLSNTFVSDKLLNSAVKYSDFILLTHRYISHSGIHSSFLKNRKPFIFNSNIFNHMLSHEMFKKTGIPFNNNYQSLASLFLEIDENVNSFQIDEKKWLEALNYFEWKNCFPPNLLKNIYK